MEYLSKLFGSPARVKVIRLFTFNPEEVFDRDVVVQKARVTPETASKELSALARASIVNRKTFFKEVFRPGSKIPKKRKTIGWVLNQKYPHLVALTHFMRTTLSVSDAEIGKRFRRAGAIKLLVLSGFLVGEREGVIDILIVGDRLIESDIKNAVTSLEAEYGQDIRYMIVPTEEYHYRRRVRDKIVREIMDFPHKEIINRLLKM
ncbi:TPA: hypothetical protein DEP58_03000 [Patescibacteria group bacterium]|nr:MAG: hypothetical protein UU98_C0018G0020 [Parcubacteria group bacterium GW2011_GWD2_42_14]HCC05249.1 hypothetical protein [Patescibacteria group bacterium]